MVEVAQYWLTRLTYKNDNMYKIFGMNLEKPCYHVTLWTRDSINSMVAPEIAEGFIDKLLMWKEEKLFFLFSFVIMHDHCHITISPNLLGDINECLKVLKSFPLPDKGNVSFWDKGRFFSEISRDEEFSNSLEKDFSDPVRMELTPFREKYIFSSASASYRHRVDLNMTGYFPEFIAHSKKQTNDIHTKEASDIEREVS